MADFLRPRIDGRERLRAQLAGPDPVVAIGAHDALSARLAEQAGATAVYMTGFGVAASRTGRPDVGLLGLAEMVDSARSMVAAIDVPLVADADTGYGGPVNVIRTVQAYEDAGVAAIQLEDQTLPKRCGHMDGKSVIPAEDMARKIEAAVQARRSDDFVVIARTDSVATDSYEEAIRRSRMYGDAGADVLFVEAPGSREQIASTPKDLAGHPVLFNWVEGGKTPDVDLDWLAECGFDLVILPISGLLAATAAMQEAYRAIVTTGRPRTPDLDFGGFLGVIGLDELTALDRRFS
ncbi:MAG: isocitrate lyase/PEP mutase family protein [Aeromicrobium sp.]